MGNTQYDPVAHHIFANVLTRKQLMEIDPTNNKVIHRVDLPGAEGNHGLYIDPATHLAFIACEDNHKLIVVNLTTQRVLSTFDVATDSDVLAFDRALGWLYVAGESGEVSEFHVQGREVSLTATGTLGRMLTLWLWMRPRIEPISRSSPWQGNLCCGSPSHKDDRSLRLGLLRASSQRKKASTGCRWHAMESDDEHGQIVVVGKEVGDGDPKHLAQSKERAGIRGVLATLVLVDSRRGNGRIHASLHAQFPLG